MLANEQAERLLLATRNTRVEQRELEQWFVRITNYAEELLKDIDQLGEWPESVRKQAA